MITITPKDALKAETLPAGWQFCKVTNHYTKPSAGDGSTNHFYELEVIDGKYKGVPLQDFLVNEKALGMGKNFFIACGHDPEAWERAKTGEPISFDEKDPIGAFIKVNVNPEKFGNRMLNKVGDCLPLTSAEKEKFKSLDA